MYFRSRMSRNGTAVAVPAAARLHRVPGSAASSRVVISNKRSSNTRPASRTARRPRWPNWSASNCWCRVLSRHWDLKICKRSPRRCSNNTKRCSNTCSSWPCFNRRIRRPQASFRHRRSSFYRIKWVYGVESSSLSVITYQRLFRWTICLLGTNRQFVPSRFRRRDRRRSARIAEAATLGRAIWSGADQARAETSYSSRTALLRFDIEIAVWRRHKRGRGCCLLV